MVRAQLRKPWASPGRLAAIRRLREPRKMRLSRPWPWPA